MTVHPLAPVVAALDAVSVTHLEAFRGTPDGSGSGPFHHLRLASRVGEWTAGREV